MPAGTAVVGIGHEIDFAAIRNVAVATLVAGGARDATSTRRARRGSVVAATRIGAGSAMARVTNQRRLAAVTCVSVTVSVIGGARTHCASAVGAGGRCVGVR